MLIQRVYTTSLETLLTKILDHQRKNTTKLTLKTVKMT